jgi:hypothetical protein
MAIIVFSFGGLYVIRSQAGHYLLNINNDGSVNWTPDINNAYPFLSFLSAERFADANEIPIYFDGQ